MPDKWIYFVDVTWIFFTMAMVIRFVTWSITAVTAWIQVAFSSSVSELNDNN